MRFVLGLLALICAVPSLTSCAQNGAEGGQGITAAVKACADSATRNEGEKAIALCNDALGLSGLTPDLQAQALISRGHVYGDRRDFDLAIADYTQALMLRPDNVLALENRAWTYNQNRDYDHAIADFDKAIMLRPSVAELYAERSYSRSMKGELASALKDINQALRLKPRDVSSYIDRGWVYMLQSEMELAIADFSSAIALDPKRSDAYAKRAIAYFVEDHYLLASLDMDKVIEIEPRGPGAYVWLYIARKRNYRDADDVLRKAANAYQRTWPSVVLHYLQGTASVSDIREESKRGEPTRSCEAAFYLGEIDLLNKRTDDATMKFRQVRDDCPRDFGERIVAEAELRRMQGQ